jgi:hypothetical protein
MPGITGLETLQKIKEVSNIPVVMITKNETEKFNGRSHWQPDNRLPIKPVNPNQVLLCLKKIIDNKDWLVKKQQLLTSNSSAICSWFKQQTPIIMSGWIFIKSSVYWELEMEKSNSPEMQEVFQTQKQEANTEFFKFISKNYANWISGKGNAPVMSHNLFKNKILPQVEKGIPTFLY